MSDDADESIHLANCPVARNEPGSCIGCDAVLDTQAPVSTSESKPSRPKRKKQVKSAYLKAQNANYMRDRRQRPKRIAGEDFRYDSVDHLPPIELDANGFAKKPPTPPEAWKYNFTLEQRKVRFLLMWNYAGGNWTIACQFSGVPRSVADAWFKTDARLPPLLERARKEIADRMRFRLLQVAGLVQTPKPVAINTTALLGLVKEYGIELPPEAVPPVVEAAPVPSAPIPVALGGIPRPGAGPVGL